MNAELIANISKSWLYNLNQALESESVDIIFDQEQVRTDNNNHILDESAYVLASPLDQWRETDGQIEANFQVWVITTQKPGDVLLAHYRNLKTQALVHNAVFSPQRLAQGYSTGDGSIYAVPLQQFDESGNPETVLDSTGIQYVGGDTWNNQSPGFGVSVWLIEIPVTVLIEES